MKIGMLLPSQLKLQKYTNFYCRISDSKSNYDFTVNRWSYHEQINTHISSSSSPLYSDWRLPKTRYLLLHC